jgi:SAM-dependent methyltransferase
MKMPKPVTLKDAEESKLFYDNRYSRGYMDDWDFGKKQRVSEIIRESGFSEFGSALDFGCGNGVWTDVIKKALPSWEVFGTDISPKAVSEAKKRRPQLDFFELVDERVFSRKFDFIFSHHVLEHVFDINETFGIINRLLKKSASMLHILPCGNPGSLEHRISSLVRNGIDKKNGRYFFEEPGHLRRLNTEQMNLLAQEYGFNLCKAYYSCHYWQAIEVTVAKNPRLTLEITNSKIARDEESKTELERIRKWLLPISIIRFPAVEFEQRKPWRLKGSRRLLENMILGTLYPFSFPFDFFVKRRAENEWNKCKYQKNGSEMSLFYKRNLPQ